MRRRRGGEAEFGGKEIFNDDEEPKNYQKQLYMLVVH